MSPLVRPRPTMLPAARFLRRAPVLLAAGGLLLSGAACQTNDTGFGRAWYEYPTRAAHDGRPDPRAEAARTQTRLDQLEAMTRRLQTQMDGLAESQAHVVAQAEARAEGARREAQSAGAEVAALRREMSVLRDEQQQLRKAADDLPARVSRAVAAASPPPTTVRRPAAPASGDAAQGYEHTVEAGQTLSEIARAYGVRMDAIVRANNLKDVGSVRVGQKLFIPKP